jgi:hypothetical protein
MMRQCQHTVASVWRFFKANHRHAAGNGISQHLILLHWEAMTVWQRKDKAVAVESSHGSLR